MVKKRSRGLQARWAQGDRPTIGFLTHGIDAFGQVLCQGVADAAREGGANLVCVVGGFLDYGSVRYPAQCRVLYDLLGAEGLDGLVIGGAVGVMASPEELVSFCQQFRPLPVVGTTLSRVLDGVPSVMAENRLAMRDVLTHLIEVHGRRRIAYLRRPIGEAYPDERYGVYTEVLAEYGLDVDPALVVQSINSRAAGKAAAGALLDERGTEFDALVADSDHIALSALEVLGERGVRVPDEVAVIGFDDIEECALVTPPLTTVHYPAYESGRRAVEMVLALLAGEEVEEEVWLPASLELRRSCGCELAAVADATVGEVRRRAKEFTRAFARRRETIVGAMAEAVGLEASRLEGLVDGFADEVGGGAEGAFVALLEKAFGDAPFRSGGPSLRSGQAWQGAISALRRGALPCLGDAATRARAETLFQRARVMVGEMARWVEGYMTLQAADQAYVLRGVGASLVATFDVGELMDVLAAGLPQLGMPGAYVSLYEDAEEPASQARLVLAVDERGRVEPEPDGCLFPSAQLVPQGVLPERQVSLVMEALFFRGHQLGFALFEAGPWTSEPYVTLRGQISSALEGALVLRERVRTEAALQQAHAQVEQRVVEQTAQLQREVTERERAQAENLRLQQNIIEAQRRAIQEMSTPIIPVAERVLVVPLIGSMDSMRARDVTRRLLAAIREQRARVVILDVTGVPQIDSEIAAHLNRTVKAVRLKGARTIITGISDAVAETIIDLGIDWSGIDTMSDLQTGLAFALDSAGVSW